jgi:hypothetical protein
MHGRALLHLNHGLTRQPRHVSRYPTDPPCIGWSPHPARVAVSFDKTNLAPDAGRDPTGCGGWVGNGSYTT